MTDTPNIDCDLVIIGAGMAGMAASLFAGNRNISTVQVGITSEIIFASGLLDLMGVHPVEHKTIRKDPWEGIEALCRDIPDHPYAKIPQKIIHDAFEELVTFLNASGLVYVRHESQNALVLTPVGTVKPSYFIPQTMWNGVQALETKEPCLIVDIEGLKGFSARQVVASFTSRWPGLNHATISFPGALNQGDVYLEPLARSLVIPQTREALADILRPHLKGARFIGMPAVFGIQDSHKILADIEKRVGVPMFEIPTMPPSIPGLRLKEAFESNLPAKGVRRFFQKRVMAVQVQKERALWYKLGTPRRKPSSTPGESSWQVAVFWERGCLLTASKSASPFSTCRYTSRTKGMNGIAMSSWTLPVIPSIGPVF